jgi:hypothetical protein
VSQDNRRNPLAENRAGEQRDRCPEIRYRVDLVAEVERYSGLRMVRRVPFYARGPRSVRLWPRPRAERAGAAPHSRAVDRPHARDQGTPCKPRDALGDALYWTDRLELGVFPVRRDKAPANKVPTTGKGGFHLASVDPSRIRQLFADATAPTGVGAVLGPCYLGVDLDNGKTGQSAWSELQDRCAPAPPTLTIATPHGRLLIFRVPEDVAPLGRAIRVGGLPVDVLCGEGYVILPTSPVHCSKPALHAPGERCPGRYETVVDVDPALAPEWVLKLPELLRPGAKGAPTERKTTPKTASGEVLALRGDARAPALYHEARRLQKGLAVHCLATSIYPAPAVLDRAIQALNRHHCSPALEDELVTRLVACAVADIGIKPATPICGPSQKGGNDGARNVTLTAIAGGLRWAGWGASAILSALEAYDDRQCQPPLQVEWGPHCLWTITSSIAPRPAEQGRIQFLQGLEER